MSFVALIATSRHALDDRREIVHQPLTERVIRDAPPFTAALEVFADLVDASDKRLRRLERFFDGQGEHRRVLFRRGLTVADDPDEDQRVELDVVEPVTGRLLDPLHLLVDLVRPCLRVRAPALPHRQRGSD